MPDRMIIVVLEQWRVWQHRSIGYVLPYPRAIRPRVLILQLGSSNSKSPRNGFRCVRGLTIITSSNVVTNLLIQATQLLNLNGIPCIRLSFHHTFFFTRIELQRALRRYNTINRLHGLSTLHVLSFFLVFHMEKQRQIIWIKHAKKCQWSDV